MCGFRGTAFTPNPQYRQKDKENSGSKKDKMMKRKERVSERIKENYKKNSY